MLGAVWWQLSRSTGIVAWLFATAAVIFGVLISGRGLGADMKANWLTDLHRWLGALTLWFLMLHLVALWADSYVEFTPTELVVPFASDWKRLAVAWGVIAMWLLVAVELSSLVKSKISRSAWKSIHLMSYVSFFAATFHGLTAGTESKQAWFVIATLAGVVAVSITTVVRVLAERKRRVVIRQSASTPGAHTSRAPDISSPS